MSVANEEQFDMDPTDGTNLGSLSSRKPRYSYAREFLLSLSELEICKRLPNGFDESLLREFEEVSQDRPRGPGHFSLQSFKRNEYGSSPPTRGEVGSYGRGGHGKWNRSSALSDRESDSQSDRDSDSGRRYGNQGRRPWQVTEHDGLLGKGSFPRTTGFPDSAALKIQSKEGYQLNRANEPYQPPRPYKGITHSRRDTKDSYNDETFGSSDLTNDDKAEEERKRRASFEILRREQQKAFQGRQKSSHDRRKEGFDIFELLEDDRDDTTILSSNKEANEPLPLSDSQTSLPPQNPTVRPLVPPGFSNTILEKNIGAKPPQNSHQPEADKNQPEGGGVQANVALQKEKEMIGQIGSNRQMHERNTLESFNFKVEKSLNSSPALDEHWNVKNNHSKKYAEVDASTNNEAGLDAENVGLDIRTEMSSQKHGPSVLDKIFESALALSDTEESAIKQDESKGGIWSPQAVKSSKFAHLFEEAPAEKKSIEKTFSSQNSNDLLSLIKGYDKDESLVVDRHNATNLLSRFPSKGSDIDCSEQLHNTAIGKSGASPPVLTCEDLEQSILSEFHESHPSLQKTTQQSNVSGVISEQQDSDIDDRASQHLLSLLQKGNGASDVVLPPCPDRHLENHLKSERDVIHDELDISSGTNSGNHNKELKTLTLEALFGTAFMKELQSVGEPVAGGNDVPEKPSSSGYASIPKDQIRPDSFPESLLGFPDQRSVSGSSQGLSGSEFPSMLGGFNQPVGVSVHEKENLIAAHAPDFQNFTALRDPEKLESGVSIDIVRNLSAVNASMMDERPFVGGQDGVHLLHQPHYMREPELPLRPNIQPLPLHRHSPPLNNANSGFHPMDSHVNNFRPSINLVPDSRIQQDSLGSRFPANAVHPPFHRSSGGTNDFGHLPLPLLQQMQLSGSLPPAHLLQRFPNGMPRPSHVNAQVVGFTPEINPTHNIPFNPRPISYGGSGIPSASEAGRNDHSASLQRLMGLNLRPDAMQSRPLGPNGSTRGNHYGRELEMLMGLGFR